MNNFVIISKFLTILFLMHIQTWCNSRTFKRDTTHARSNTNTACSLFYHKLFEFQSWKTLFNRQHLWPQIRTRWHDFYHFLSFCRI